MYIHAAAITLKFEVSKREIEADENGCQNIQVSANELLSRNSPPPPSTSSPLEVKTQGVFTVVQLSNKVITFTIL